MTRLDIHGATGADVWPDGTWIAQMRGGVIRSSQGDIPTPGFDLLYPRLTLAGGLQVAGQAQREPTDPQRGTWKWRAGTWTHETVESHGVNPVIFDNWGTLHIATPAVGSQGYRYVADDGRLVTGDETINSETDLAKSYGLSGFWEWTRSIGVTIGQGQAYCLTEGPHGRRVLEPGGCYDIHFVRVGSSCAVSLIKRSEDTASLFWFQANELADLPLEPTTEPPTEPPAADKPTCTIADYPRTVEKGQPAVCTAAYGGGLAERAVWLSRSLGEVVWFTEGVQSPPERSFAYAFPDAGTVDVALRVEGPGGSDETTGLRRITVTDPATEPEPEPSPMRLPVCFGPNLGTLDLPQLFTEDNLWRWSYDRIAAFQFYQGHIGPIGIDLGERFCQPNTFEKLVEAQAFKKLKAAGILLELQMTGGSGPDIVRQLAARIALLGQGELGAVCYDHMFSEIDGPTFASYVKTLRAEFPGFIIGAYVAYPMASVQHILERVQVWDSLDGRPDFLRMDVDYNQRDTYTADVHARIRDICQQRGMTHQVVINAKEHISDAEYVTQGKAWFDRAKALGFDAFACQSWASTPSDEQRELPHNLNEGDADAHTSLVRYVLEALS